MKPRAVLRTVPEDFVVDEIPAYEPTGSGEHLAVRIRKRNLTTPEVLARLCRGLDVDARGAGFAGMKDRRAVTTQMLTVPYGLGRPLPVPNDLASEGLEVLEVTRTAGKLRPGHLRGNRFSIVLRELAPESVAPALAALNELACKGVPNAFGPQRFGRDGDNPERTLAWLTGRTRGPRDRRAQRFLFSSLQAKLFDEVLEARIADGTWDRPLQGDLLKKHVSGGLFECAEPEKDGERAAQQELSPTGPIFGASMRWPTLEPARIERETLDRAGIAALLERWRALGEGTRRSLRMFADELRAIPIENEPAALRVDFVLPKGGYATTLLSCVVCVEDKAPSEEEMAQE